MSLDEISREFEFRTDRNYYVDLRKTIFVLMLEVNKERGYYDSYKNKKSKRQHEPEATASTGTSKEGANEAGDNSREDLILMSTIYCIRFFQ